MTTAWWFCGQCGTRGAPVDRFCGNCGQPGAAVPVVATTAWPTASPRLGTNGMAVASFVLGLLGFWVFAVVFGFVGLHQIKDRRRMQGGRGLAIAGVILGFLWLGAIAAFVIVVEVKAHSSGFGA